MLRLQIGVLKDITMRVWLISVSFHRGENCFPSHPTPLLPGGRGMLCEHNHTFAYIKKNLYLFLCSFFFLSYLPVYLRGSFMSAQLDPFHSV